MSSPVLSTAMRSACDLFEADQPPFTPHNPMNTLQLCPRRHPVRAIGVLACLLATISQLNAGLPLLPEQIVVTCFSGTINYYGSPPTVTPNLRNRGMRICHRCTPPGQYV